ncbi:hypothetical protein SAMN05444392_106118 [Seinonella peptonophila]|uniref:Uncharacterized protein n=1 Tax=Seinonella peptonophila TaxID=112248 RepID=A0A1M4Y9A5_9BACL|nr:hypothetical protein [Seinonella peptonophila]SHF02354.1 hypothetical protein SAMN05444392_106118 [Seinonella peptonophila]
MKKLILSTQVAQIRFWKQYCLVSKVFLNRQITQSQRRNSLSSILCEERSKRLQTQQTLLRVLRQLYQLQEASKAQQPEKQQPWYSASRFNSTWKGIFLTTCLFTKLVDYFFEQELKMVVSIMKTTILQTLDYTASLWPAIRVFLGL